MSDKEIVAWCAGHAHVLVTSDGDFKGRWIRSGLLASHGVEVIVFNQDIQGINNQQCRITKHLPEWQSDLEGQPYAHHVWIQHKKRRLRLKEGRKEG